MSRNRAARSSHCGDPSHSNLVRLLGAPRQLPSLYAQPNGLRKTIHMQPGIGVEEGTEVGRFRVPDCSFPEIVTGLFGWDPIASPPDDATGFPAGIDLRGLEAWVEFTVAGPDVQSQVGPSIKRIRFDLDRGTAISLPCSEVAFKVRYGPPPPEVVIEGSVTPPIEVFSWFGCNSKAGVAGVGANVRLSRYVPFEAGEETVLTMPVEVPPFARSVLVMSPDATVQSTLTLRELRSAGNDVLVEATGAGPLDTQALPIVQGCNFVDVSCSAEDPPDYVVVVFLLAIA